jgi:hypothetical protein
MPYPFTICNKSYNYSNITWLITSLYNLYKRHKNAAIANCYKYAYSLIKDAFPTFIIIKSLAESSYNTSISASRMRLTIVIIFACNTSANIINANL